MIDFDSFLGGMVLEASPTWTEGYSYIYFLFIPIRSTAPPPSIILEVFQNQKLKTLYTYFRNIYTYLGRI